MKKLILASASPRRKQLLEMIGVSCKVVPSNIEEKLNPRLKPKSQAESLSLQKAEHVAQKYEDAFILAADTFISIHDEILGKPKDREDAKRMLRKLSGKTHSVFTGFSIIDTKRGKAISRSCETKVSMKKLTQREIDEYVKKEDLLDKSGSYAIQGIAAIFIEKIEGDFFNIVGLPVYTVAQELKRFGIKVL